MSIYMIRTDRGEVFAAGADALEAAKREIKANTIGEVSLEVDGPHDYVEIVNEGITFDPQEVDQ